VYTVNTSSFGKINLKEAQVSRIQSGNLPVRNEAAGFSEQPSNPAGLDMDSYKQRLMGNPENTAIITGLATDPQIQDLIQDPDIAAAAKSGDLQALMKNKKFMDIANNPEMQKKMDGLKK
jgi:hypothetical protein